MGDMPERNMNECLEHRQNIWRIGKVEGDLKAHIDSDEKKHSDHGARFVALERTVFKFGIYVAVVNTIVGLVVSAVTVGGKLGWF